MADLELIYKGNSDELPPQPIFLVDVTKRSAAVDDQNRYSSVTVLLIF